MLEDTVNWINENVKCCACGRSMESQNVNMVQLKKVATWRCPVAGSIDVRGYKPRALAIICDECLQNKEKIRHAIEWEGTPCLVTYHDVDKLQDDEQNISLLDFVFEKMYRHKIALMAAKQQCQN